MKKTASPKKKTKLDPPSPGLSKIDYRIRTGAIRRMNVPEDAGGFGLSVFSIKVLVVQSGLHCCFMKAAAFQRNAGRFDFFSNLHYLCGCGCKREDRE